MEYKTFCIQIREAIDKLKKALEKNDIASQIASFESIVFTCVPVSKNILKQKEVLKLWKKYDKRVKDLLKQPIAINNCYYFIDFAFAFADENISEADANNVFRLFSAFDNTVSESLAHADKNAEFIKKLEEKVKNVINDGPGKADPAYNSAFKNFINEIAFFYHIANNQHIGLDKIEVKLQDSENIKKTADFHLVCEDSEYYVDTITIHNTKEQVDLDMFVEGKVDDKIKEKTSEIQDEYIKKQFRVQPIIEFDDERLIDYVPNLPNDKCFPPMLSLQVEHCGKWYLQLNQFPLDEKTKNDLTKNK